MCVCVCPACVCVCKCLFSPSSSRKAHLRDIKLLQRAEMKEATIFYNKITGDRESQERKFEADRQVENNIN